MCQADAPIAEAIVWCVADHLDGPDLVRAAMPDVPDPDDSPLVQELAVDGQRRPSAFWDNFEYRPLSWLGPEAWERRVDAAAEVRSWFRYLPTAAFDDPYVEAARVAMLIDISGWPALVRALSPSEEARWIAPNLDLAVAFHTPTAGAEHLLLDGYASIATGGLAAGGGSVWSRDGRLLGSGTQQLIFRPVPPS
jgi:acyl-CoA thioesterase